MKRKRALLLTVSMLVLIFAVQVTTAYTKTVSKEPIKIGAVLPLTGGLSIHAPFNKGGMEVAIDEFNWQIHGRPIKIIYEDDNSFDEVMALQKFRKLCEVDKVQVMFGPMASSSLLGTETYIDVVKMPTFQIGWQGEFKAWDKPGWQFAAGGALAQQAYPGGTLAYKMGHRTATTIGVDYETGYQGAGAFADGFRKAGGTVVQQQWAPMGTPDWGPYFSGLKKADCTAAIVLGGDMMTLAKQWHEFGLWDKRPLIYLANEGLLSSTLKQLGDFMQGLFSVTDYTWTIDTPKNKKFVSAFEAKTGLKPSPIAFITYINMSLALHAIEKAGGNTDPEAIREAVLGLTIETPTGPVTFDKEKGYTIKNIFGTEVQKVNGELAFVVINTFPNAPWPGYYTKP